MTATRATAVAAEAGLEELRLLHALNREVDSLIDAFIQSLTYGELTETPVKNVAKPLRHHRLFLPD